MIDLRFLPLFSRAIHDLIISPRLIVCGLFPHSYQFNQQIARTYCFPSIASLPFLQMKCRNGKYIKDKGSIFVMWVLAILVSMGIDTSDSFFLSLPQYLSAYFVPNNYHHRHLLCLKIYGNPPNYYIMTKNVLRCHFILIQSNSFRFNRLLPFQALF